MTRLVENVLDLVGDTPLVAIRVLAKERRAAVWAKMEQANPGGSVKDRICRAMVEDAERSGQLKPNGVVVEPTSGNTGIGLALVCAVRGYRCILAMPESMSLERRQLLEAFGAEVVLTPSDQQMEGAVAKAREIAQRTPGAFMPQQFDNPANPRAHAESTAREIIDAMRPLRIDALVVGVGTGGTISGVGEVLRRELSPAPRIIGVEPESCATISRGERGPTRFRGSLPASFRRITIRPWSTRCERWQTPTRGERRCFSRVAKDFWWALVPVRPCTPRWRSLANSVRGRNVVTVLPDTGERYFSLEEYFPEVCA